MFPQNRIQALAATLEVAFTERLSGLAIFGQGLTAHLPTCDTVLALLEARRAYLVASAAEKYDGWREAVVPYAETGTERIVALSDALGKLTENTQQTGLRAARHLQAMAFALLVTLGTLIQSKRSKPPRRETAPARAMSAAQCFTRAQLAAHVFLKYWERQSDRIWAIAHPARLRNALPLPRSEFPSPLSA